MLLLPPAEEEDEGEKDGQPKTKKVSETVWEWEVLNDNQALWLRPPGNVSEEEYAKFYKALAKVGEVGGAASILLLHVISLF